MVASSFRAGARCPHAAPTFVGQPRHGRPAGDGPGLQPAGPGRHDPAAPRRQRPDPHALAPLPLRGHGSLRRLRGDRRFGFPLDSKRERRASTRGGRSRGTRARGFFSKSAVPRRRSTSSSTTLRDTASRARGSRRGRPATRRTRPGPTSRPSSPWRPPRAPTPARPRSARDRRSRPRPRP